MFRKLFAGLLAAIMVGCAAVPESLRTESDNPLTDIVLITQQQASSPTEQPEVRLGGVIASIRNDADKTRLEIVALPISASGKPELGANPEQRFIAYIDGFVEPMAYHSGRLITVAGRVTGQEQGTVGDFPYTYPVVTVTGSQLWQVKKELWMMETDPFPPCWGLHCSPYRANPWSRGEVRERVTQ
ncbi:Slp family lipoprotein [Photobacterium aphoticum]|uniref:Starvation lipoprotein Slp paralog n=1 Tax=Photobacterium aphoticum TaxID=754436 RepID=A0A0J1JEJ4_9GAMM|nr:Slp family lipoprotein [Photobacterium aphoticum]KLV00082.1 hypothetical protein ABT58_13895 [Photobacterium aphoticum]PSU55888.1 starvation-inducible protein [Photobacterium aphoticum]GHA48597.1 starvation lipoprotein Slp [Photobacterium aphoticum]